MSQTIQSKEGPQFDLPFSHAVRCGDFVYVSGQVGVEPNSLNLVGDTVEEQTIQCFKNIETILASAGLTLDHVVKFQIFLSKVEDIPAFNKTYREVINAPFPTRTTIQCGLGGYLIEVDAIAYSTDKRRAEG